MKLDRDLQRELLQALASAYPGQISLQNFGTDREAVSANAAYLDEHGLINAVMSRAIGAQPTVIMGTITAKGMDFLADDGGLTAILGVVTVKLHADTIRELLESRIVGSNLPPPEKNALIKHLRTLPAEALKRITTRLLDEALNHLPDAIPLLQILLDF